jgi:GH25 family lysozyme M1 (1,4-beta-N-acetylmuramidase)
VRVPELLLPDVSEFQPDVAWKEVAAANGGAAIIRALYGSARVDEAWAAGAREKAHAGGVHVLGIYQYLVGSEPVAPQAARFIEVVGRLEPGEFAVLDLEEGVGDQAERAKVWFETVDAKLTYPGYHGAWLYSGASFLTSAGLLPIAESPRHTWVADYSASPPSVPHTLWQYSDAAPWKGIGHCDSSKFDGTLQELREKIASGR